MNSIFKFMEQDHDRLDKIFEEFKLMKNTDKNKAINLFRDFKTGLQRHIVWEEEILFPVFESKTGIQDKGPTEVMRLEHRQIKEAIEKIHDKIAKENLKGIDEAATKLILVLKPHNDKEENILYPWIDDSLSNKEKENIFTQIKNLPEEKYNKCCQP